MDMSKLNALSTEQLRALNSAIVDVIRQRQTNDAFEQARLFRIGQIVQFKDKSGELRKMKIDRVNIKTVSGVEIGMRDRKWRVHPSFLSATV